MTKLQSDILKENMALWDAVSETDPAYTKPVEYGRKFTAICAQYQIMQATKQWGQIGKDWHVEHDIVHVTETDLVVLVKIFAPGCEEAVTGYGSEHSAKQTLAQNDSHKKAYTDGLTKALSHLGFSADVFMGQYDDNKYVQGLKTKYGDNSKAEKPPQDKKEPPPKQSESDADAPRCPVCNTAMKLRTSGTGHKFWSCPVKLGNVWCVGKADYKAQQELPDAVKPDDKQHDPELRGKHERIGQLRELLKWSKEDSRAKTDEWGLKLSSVNDCNVIIQKLEVIYKAEQGDDGKPIDKDEVSTIVNLLDNTTDQDEAGKILKRFGIETPLSIHKVTKDQYPILIQKLQEIVDIPEETTVKD